MDSFIAFFRSLEVDHIEMMNPRRPLNGEGTVFFKGAYYGYSMKAAWMDDKKEGLAVIYAPDGSVFAEFTCINDEIIDVLTYPPQTSNRSPAFSPQAIPPVVSAPSGQGNPQSYFSSGVMNTTSSMTDPQYGYKQPRSQEMSVISTSSMVNPKPSVVSIPASPDVSVISTPASIPSIAVSTQSSVGTTRPIFVAPKPVEVTIQSDESMSHPGLVSLGSPESNPPLPTYPGRTLPLERQSLTHRCLERKGLFWTVVGIIVAVLILIVLLCVYLAAREEGVELTSDKVRIPKNVKTITVRELESGSLALTKIDLDGLPKVTSFTAVYMSFPRISYVSLTSRFEFSFQCRSS